MLFSSQKLIAKVIEPTLSLLDCNSPVLRLFIAAVAEVNATRNDFDQFGLYSITHLDHWNLWDNFLVHDPLMASKIRGFASQRQFLEDPDEELNTNLRYSTAIMAMLLKSHLVDRTLEDASLNDLLLSWKHSSINPGTRQISEVYLELNRVLSKNAA